VWFQWIVTSLLLSQRSTYAQLSMCVKFVLILALGSYHRNLDGGFEQED
jgi:hypothetical protein